MRLTLQAHAKINLTLEVLGKRPDGYHEISSVMQTISLADTLTFEPARTLDFYCDVSSLQTPHNLVLKAAMLLKETTGCNKGAVIHVSKKIPAAAGLGSGSTDAAATLIGLNQLWELNLTLDRLLELAAKLGSDIAFFLYQGTALAKGRGELVTPLSPAPKFWLVLVNPSIKPVPQKTAKLYAQLDKSHFTSGQHTHKLINHLNHGGKVENSFIFNVFEQVAFDFFSSLKDYQSRLLAAGAPGVHLAGSGPALFTLVQDEAQAEIITKRLEKDGLQVFPAHSIGGRKC